MHTSYRLPVVFFLLALSCSIHAQLNFIEWQKSYGGSEYDFAYDIKQLPDGGYIVAGYTLSDNGDVSVLRGYADLWVIRIGATGELIWEKTYGGTEGDYANAIEPTTDGGFIVAGYTYSNDFDVSGNNGYYDMWVLKLTSEGDITWKNTYGGSSNETGYDIIPTSEGGYMLVGLTSSTDGDVSENDGGIDVWVVKLDSTGIIQWEKTFGGTEIDIAFTVVQTADGGYIVGGDAFSSDGDVTGFQGGVDCWILKLDSDGDLIWQKTMGGSQGEELKSIEQTTDGGYVFLGWTESNDGDISHHNGRPDAWVVKTDADGNILWERSFGTSSVEYGSCVSQTNDGGYIVTGSIMPQYDTLDQEFDYWVVKLDAMGGTEWQKSYGGSMNDMSFAIQQTSDSHFIIAGFSTSNDGDVSGNHGSADIWIAKLGEGEPHQLTLSINDTTIVTENGTYAYAIVSLSGPSTEVVKVAYKTKNGTALKGSDYVATTGILRFLPGQTSRHIRVTIKSDLIPEPDEFFLIKLSDPVNAALLQDEGMVIITESELVPNNSGETPSYELTFPIHQELSEPIVPNPQSRLSSFQVLHSTSDDMEILLMDEGGKIFLHQNQYANDWHMDALNPGMYLYRIRYKHDNGIPVELSGKVFITD